MDQLIEAIENSGRSRYDIAKSSGVENSVLSRIINGKQKSISFTTLERLCEDLGFEIVLKKRRK